MFVADTENELSRDMSMYCPDCGKPKDCRPHGHQVSLCFSTIVVMSGEMVCLYSDFWSRC